MIDKGYFNSPAPQSRNAARPERVSGSPTQQDLEMTPAALLICAAAQRDCATMDDVVAAVRANREPLAVVWLKEWRSTDSADRPACAGALEWLGDDIWVCRRIEPTS